MGCRCCKMIQSYIFDPQDVSQPSGHINEINNDIKNCKSDEQDGGKLKCKSNCSIQVQKNELQNSGIQPTGSKQKLNNTKNDILNHKSISPEERLESSGEKCNFAVNGICTGMKSIANPSINQNKENSRHTCHDQQPDPSAKEVSQMTKCENHESLKSEDNLKLPLEITGNDAYKESQNSRGNSSPTQIAIPGAQGNGTLLSGLNHLADPNQAVKEGAAGSENFLNGPIPRSQSTEYPAIGKHRLVGESTCCALTDRGCRGGPSGVCLKDKMYDETPTPGTKRDCHNEVHGELDAEIAEALAALEAATAGEDFEDEEDY